MFSGLFFMFYQISRECDRYLLMRVSISGRGPLARLSLEGDASLSSSKSGAGDKADSQLSSASVYLRGMSALRSSQGEVV